MLSYGLMIIRCSSIFLRLNRLYLGDQIPGYISPLPITEVQQVSSAILLGVTLCDTLSITTHVESTLRICSQRVYLLKLLWNQGITRHYLHVVFDALVLSKLRYTICAWSGFLSAELEGQINALLKRAFKYGFCTKIYTIQSIAEEADKLLFRKMMSANHCIDFFVAIC